MAFFAFIFSSLSVTCICIFYIRVSGLCLICCNEDFFRLGSLYEGSVPYILL